MSSIPADAERLAAHIAGMNRQALKNELLHFQGNVRLDFTEEYLNGLSLERLRHILLAARLQRPLH